MIKNYIVFIIIMLVFTTSSIARESTEELAERLLEGQKKFEILKQQRGNALNRIMSDDTLSSKGKQKAIRNLQEGFLKSSRDIHITHREPFIQRVIEETNAQLPEDGKITKGLGSDIYSRHKITKKVIKDSKGRKVLNPKHRGWQGDLDLGGNPMAVEKLNKSFSKYGVSLTSDMVNAPGYQDFKEIEVTINIEGSMDKPSSDTHLTQTQMNSFSKETYVSVGMKKSQAGRRLVETNDHIKKAIEGFNASAAKLVSMEGEDVLQGMGKGTLKSMDSGGIANDQLKKILKDVGYKGGVKTFKKQLVDIKAGHLASGVGLNEKNIKVFQLASKQVTEQAVRNAKKLAAFQIKNTELKIGKLKKLVNLADTSPGLAEKYKNSIKYYQEELADSRIKIEQTAIANQEKLNGGSYDTFYKRKPDNLGKDFAKVIRKPSAASAAKISRINAIKKGLKPDLLSVVGYGISASSIYDTRQKFNKGKITENEAITAIAGEVVNTGFGVVVNVGTAAAVTGTATGVIGTLATIAAPFVVTAAASYSVSEATKEGLKLVVALKNEDISTKIADSKIQEAVNRFKLKVNELMRLGVDTGDWRYFAQADDIVYKLDNMYAVTKDKTIYQASNRIFDQVEQVKEGLQKKYGVSIYALKEKIEGEQKEIANKSIEIVNLIVDTSPSGKTHKKVLTGDDSAYLFAYYKVPDGIATVTVDMSVKDKSSGRLLSSEIVERSVKKGVDVQRVGLLLDSGTVQPGSSAVFQVTITGLGSKAVSRNTSFKVSVYNIALAVPASLNAGQKHSFDISVPSTFEPPYQIRLSVGKGLIVYHKPGSLRGDVVGENLRASTNAALNLTVVDARGRSGNAKASILIKAEQIATTSYLPPPPSSSDYVAIDDRDPNAPPGSDAFGYSGNAQEINTPHDYVALGNKRFRDWFSKFTSSIVPYCASDLSRKWKNKAKTIKPHNKTDSEKWGRASIWPELYNLERYEENMLLKATMKEVKSLKYNDCLDKLASKLAVSADVNGLGSASFLRKNLVAAMKNNSRGSSASSSKSAGQRETYWMKCRTGSRRLFGIHSVQASSPEKAIQKANARQGGNLFRCWGASNAPNAYKRLSQEWCQQPGAGC